MEPLSEAEQQMFDSACIFLVELSNLLASVSDDNRELLLDTVDALVATLDTYDPALGARLVFSPQTSRVIVTFEDPNVDAIYVDLTKIPPSHLS